MKERILEVARKDIDITAIKKRSLKPLLREFDSLINEKNVAGRIRSVFLCQIFCFLILHLIAMYDIIRHMEGLS